MLQQICAPIASDPDVHKVIDAFAGTGTIAYALCEHKKIVSNDLEYYAYIINEAILNGCHLSSEELARFRARAEQIYTNISSRISNIIQREDSHLNGNGNMEEYSDFVKCTPSVFSDNNAPYTALYAPLHELVLSVLPHIGHRYAPLHCLFLTYYANTYFGIRQCCCIDALRASIDELVDERQKRVLLTALMAAMSQTSSTTTHFAQYLKINNTAAYLNLIKKRKADLFELTFKFIEEFRKRGLLQRHAPSADCYNGDFADCLQRVQLDEHTLVYADPPYFKEHYSRYYHLLNTLCLYDYPQPDINPQRKTYSVGRYRADRISSDFGKKAKALEAFKRLISLCAAHNSKLVISYSENSIISIDALKDLVSEYYNVHSECVALRHSLQGRQHSKKLDVNEYIFFCSPTNRSQHPNYKLLQENIKKIKPQVDNPGGLIHNYVARKPYNVVSRLIAELTQSGDVVFDPMFGSGTTIIEASKLNRSAIGCDINPIGYKIANISLRRWDLSQIILNLSNFIDEIENACEPLYSIQQGNETRILERCHFNYDKTGTLIPISYWYKTNDSGKLSRRKKAFADAPFRENYQLYRSQRLKSITDTPLLANSRIAIKKGATILDYFCHRNRIALDIIIRALRKYWDKNAYGKEVLEVLVSSAINLIKLSDKKASSQIPYWLPKLNVTSRNAAMILSNKADAMVRGLSYLQEQCQSLLTSPQSDKQDCTSHIKLYNKPSQLLTYRELQNESVDLILTDPPYADQVPYLEYSQLWNILLSPETDIPYEQELVVSNAPERQKGFAGFYKDFQAIILRSVKALKPKGHFVMFYHSFDLADWAAIDKTMREAGLVFCVQFPSPSPRKSFKSVTSPMRTLDGNYIIIYRKDTNVASTCTFSSIDEVCARIIMLASGIIKQKGGATTQDLYDGGLLNDAVSKGYIAILASQFSSFTDIIKNYFTYNNGYWRL